jgi:diketogulonate reductase-like aldo/keto reductase
VLLAIERGCRLIDTANGYSNQRAVGAALRRALAAGLVARGELCVVSKLSSRQLGSAAAVRPAAPGRLTGTLCASGESR